MKTIKNVQFVSNSNNRNALKALTEKENAFLMETLEKAKENGLKNFAIIFTVKGFDGVYGFKTTMENCVKRIKTDNTKSGLLFKIFCPISVGQAREFITSEKVTCFGTLDELKAIREKHNLSNNGKAVEYLVKRYEHKTVEHTQALEKGGDALFGDTEIKYFELGFGTSPSCKLIENAKI